MAAFDPPRQRAQAPAAPRGSLLAVVGLSAAVLLAAGAVLLPVVQSSTLTATGVDIRQMERRKADLEAAIYKTQAEIAQLGSIERIDREARGRLGMAPAARTVTLSVSAPPPPRWSVPARYLPPAAPPAVAATPAPSWRTPLERLVGR